MGGRYTIIPHFINSSQVVQSRVRQAKVWAIKKLMNIAGREGERLIECEQLSNVYIKRSCDSGGMTDGSINRSSFNSTDLAQFETRSVRKLLLGNLLCFAKLA